MQRGKKTTNHQQNKRHKRKPAIPVEKSQYSEPKSNNQNRKPLILQSELHAPQYFAPVSTFIFDADMTAAW